MSNPTQANQNSQLHGQAVEHGAEAGPCGDLLLLLRYHLHRLHDQVAVPECAGRAHAAVARGGHVELHFAAAQRGRHRVAAAVDC